MSRSAVLALPLALALVGCGGSKSGGVPTDPSPPSGTTRLYVDDVFATSEQLPALQYGSALPAGGSSLVPLLLDLYRPAGDTRTSRPVIVWIHGGGFVSGTRADPAMVELCRRLARKGYVTASITYRLRTSAQQQADSTGAYLDAVADAKAAVRWLRSQANVYGLDTARIAIGGGSAGAFAALGAAHLEAEGSSGSPGWSSQVDAVVDFWGGLPDLSQLDAGEAPALIIHGTADATVPFSSGEALFARAQAVGVPSEFRPLQGAPHGFWSPMDQYVGWIAPFLRLHLGLP